MREKLVNKKSYMSLIGTLSTAFFFFFYDVCSTVASWINLNKFTHYFKVTSSERE